LFELKKEVFMLLTIDRFGRMVLPKSMRDDFGLRAGDTLEVEASADAILLRPSSGADCTVHEGRVLVFNGGADGDVVGALARVREARLNRAGGGAERT